MNYTNVNALFLAELAPVTQWAVSGAAVAATAFVLFRTKMKKKKDPLSRSSDSQSLAQQRSVERQMQNLLVELSEMARQVTAGLDTRAAKLDSLIQEADAKIAALTALNNAAPAIVQSATLVAAPPPPNAYEPDPRHVEVYVLADQGQSAGQIASQLNRPNGEIELILALRPRS